MTTALAQASDHPEAVPLAVNAFGNTYGEWSARWWQSALSIPADTNPLLDPTGAHCAEGQGGQVWFLAGTLGCAATRSCSVPGGKALFFPILNVVFGQPSYCTGPSDCDVTALRVAAAAEEDNPATLTVSIDGHPVKHPRRLRVTSPVFTYFLPAGNFLDLPPGTYGPLGLGWTDRVLLSPATRPERTYHPFARRVQYWFCDAGDIPSHRDAMKTANEEYRACEPCTSRRSLAHTVLTRGDVQTAQGVVSEDIVNVPMCDERILPQPWRAV